MRILIFTFNENGSTYRNVFSDNADPTLITSKQLTYTPGQDLYPDYTDGDNVGTPTCQGTTLTGYTFSSTTPFANYYQIFNSPYCGYIPTACDLSFSSISHTNETNTGTNDGTASIFFTSSHLPILYQLLGSGQSNNTGYFTGLTPGTYEAYISDNLGCLIQDNFITILPFDTTKTRFKYRLAFTSVKTNINWEVRFLYQKSQFDPLLYPKDLTGTDSPVKKKTVNTNEDKTDAFAPTSVDFNIYVNEVFEVSEFSNAQERDWKIEIYANSNLDFQGWLLPDELQDFYSDPNYGITMTATDGLLSLKGSTFGDQSLFYTDAFGQKHLYELFGLKKWLYLVEICLNQLGYDCGLCTILSSLCYQNTSNWANYSTWADLFYDANGTPKDTYSALEILLKGMKLQIFQRNGSFVLWDTNDVYWRNITDISPYCFSTDFVTISSGTIPENKPIGANTSTKPINPIQSLNYDKSFSQMEADVSFSLLSLLYPNPSFEFNSIQGHLPDGYEMNGSIDAFVNYDPQDPLNPNIGAYSGDWELTSQLIYSGGYNFTNYIRPNPKWIIDQTNMKVNFSYYWRAHYLGAGYENSLPITLLVFYGASGTNYSWYIPASGIPAWTTGSEPYSHTASPNVHITDYNAWNNFSVTTDALPEASGQLEVRIGAPSFYFAGSFPPNGTFFRVDIDAMQITLSDASNPYNFQKGENHIVTNITTFAKSEKKTIDLSLFTFPDNKRVSGNVSLGSDYATSSITNEWSFKLSVEQAPDRLPANIIRRFAKTYQRPMYKYQGDFLSDVANYYAVWILSGHENRVFIAFTIEIDLRNSTGNIVLIEIDDTQMQSSYSYLPIYEKSARNNLS